MRKAVAIAALALGIFLLGTQELRASTFVDQSGLTSESGAHVSAPPVVRVAPTAHRARPTQRLLRPLWALLLVLLVAAATTTAAEAPSISPRSRVPWRGPSRRGPPVALA
jgi:hypothetical protein